MTDPSAAMGYHIASSGRSYGRGKLLADTRICYETLKACYFDLESGQLIYLLAFENPLIMRGHNA
jgi:hypothetical protein